MKVKKLSIPVIVIFSVVAAILFLIVFFYYMSFRQLNEIIAVSNRGMKNIKLEENIISEENQNKITFVKKPKEKTFYVDGVCIPIINGVGIGEATYTCTADYTVYEPYKKEIIQEMETENFKVTMKFIDWKWVVDTVQIVDDR